MRCADFTFCSHFCGGNGLCLEVEEIGSCTPAVWSAAFTLGQWQSYHFEGRYAGWVGGRQQWNGFPLAEAIAVWSSHSPLRSYCSKMKPSMVWGRGGAVLGGRSQRVTLRLLCPWGAHGLGLQLPLDRVVAKGWGVEAWCDLHRAVTVLGVIEV